MKTREFQKYDYYSWSISQIQYITGATQRVETVPARIGEVQKNGDMITVIVGGDMDGDMGLLLVMFLNDEPESEDFDLRNYYTHVIGGPVTLTDVNKTIAMAEDILTMAENTDDAFVVLRQVAKKYSMHPAVQR